MRIAKRNLFAALAVICVICVFAFLLREYRMGVELEMVRAVVGAKLGRYPRVQCALYHGNTIKVSGMVSTEEELRMLKEEIARAGIRASVIVASDEESLPMMNGK